MKLISLSGKHGVGKFTVVDDDIYELVKNFEWFLKYHPETMDGYALRMENFGEKKAIKIWLHHIPIGFPLGMVLIDHRNRNKLDNRRENLRIATFAQNMHNVGRKNIKHLTSKYKGVSYDISRRKWTSGLTENGRRISFGRFNDEEEARRVYDERVVLYRGEFAVTNRDLL